MRIERKKNHVFSKSKTCLTVELKKKKKTEKVLLKMETFFFSIHFELSNKFSSLKNKKLFLEIENRKKKAITKYTLSRLE